MKYLIIKDNKGSYWNGNEYQDIDKINKEDLLVLLNLAETEDFEMDIYNEKSLGNKAHQIIYKNINDKFSQFLKDKDKFSKEAEDLYKNAIKKYSVEVNDKSDEVEENVDFEEENQINVEDIPF